MVDCLFSFSLKILLSAANVFQAGKTIFPGGVLSHALFMACFPRSIHSSEQIKSAELDS